MKEYYNLKEELLNDRGVIITNKIKMKYNKNLLKQNLARFQNKKWYHQRFDGCVHFLFYIVEGESRPEQRKQGWHNYNHACFFNNDRADWFIPMEDINRITREIIEKAKTYNNISRNLMKLWDEDEKNFYEICNRIQKMQVSGELYDESKLNDKKLFNLYKEFSEKTILRCTSSSIIDGFALGSDEIVADMIINFLKEKNLLSNYSDVFSKLTAPVDQSFINEAEVNLLRIALMIEDTNNGMKKFILSHSVEESLKELDKKEFLEIKEKLEEHEKSYFWSKNNYVHANILDKKHFMKEIKDIFETGFNISAEIKKIVDTPVLNKKIKEKLMDELDIPQHLRNLLKILEDFTKWQDDRKKATYWYIHYGSLLIEEIGRRCSLSLNEMKYLTPAEIKLLEESQISADGKVSDEYKKEIQQRAKESAFIDINEECLCVISEELETLKKAVLETEDYSKIKEFKGLSASTGYAKGRVKIIKSATEAGKVERGDVLVAVMTRPDYVSAMKKAAAIVTEEGGVTCHAAIVSRELKIPCIIGTKIATKALKDGQMVEVDADNGVVRKIG
ncbi:MAG: PEP-utilizing enzyme [Candidatus Woesearchaeota archaeon]